MRGVDIEAVMGKTESVIIGILLLIGCPLAFFVVGWWGSALLVINDVVPIPKWGIAASALAGLGVGIILAVARLKLWVRHFYGVRPVLGAGVYLFFSAVAVAFCMGLPLGNLLLGALAGLYVGRGGYHANLPAAALAEPAHRVSLFTAAVIGLVALTMGLLALQEQHAMRQVLQLMGLDKLAHTPAGRISVVAVAVPVLTVLQYWLTRQAARRGFRRARNEV
jgi:hypothetical protein